MAGVDRVSLETLIHENKTKPRWEPSDIGDRIRFSSSEKKRKKLLQEIDDCNRKLQEITAQGQRVTPIMKTWRKRLTDPLHRIRTHADILHRALVSVSRCACSPSHEVKMLLPKLSQTEDNTQCQFKMVICSGGSNVNSKSLPLWNWQEMEVIVNRSAQFPELVAFNFDIPLDIR
jgi:hypothetical protein